MKAKEYSLIGMIIGGVCLIGLFISVIIKFLNNEIFTITIEQALSMIILGMAPSIPFCPIYFSITLDKINEIKNGKKETNNETN